MRKFIYLTLILASLTSCLTPKQAKERYGCKPIETTITKDTTVVEKDTTIVTPADTAELDIPFDLNYKRVGVDADVWKQEAKGKTNARVSTVYDPVRKVLRVTANCDELKQVVASRDTTIHELQKQVVNLQQEKKSWLSRQISALEMFLLKLFAIIGVVATIWFTIKMLLSLGSLKLPNFLLKLF